MKCEFCEQEFDCEGDYLVHLKLVHPDEYQEKRSEKAMTKYLEKLGAMFPTMLPKSTSDFSNLAISLTDIGLRYAKTPDEVYEYYERVLAWLEGRAGKSVVITTSPKTI